MVEDRLNGLELLHIHADIEINVDNIIERFANQGTHRLEFIL
jgi:hypothetical protein